MVNQINVILEENIIIINDKLFFQREQRHNGFNLKQYQLIIPFNRISFLIHLIDDSLFHCSNPKRTYLLTFARIHHIIIHFERF